MKKSFLLTALAVIAIAFAFVSCSGNAAPEDRLGKITFGDDDSRVVGTVVTYSNQVEDMYWYYTAEKLDDGYSTGATSTLLPVAVDEDDNPIQGLSGKTLNDNFSYGLWKIELKGFLKTDDVSDGAVSTTVNGVQYKATVDNLLVEKNITNASAEIVLGDNPTTKIEFGTISFSATNITENSKFSLAVTDNKGTVTVPENCIEKATAEGGEDTTVKNPAVVSGSVSFGGLTYSLSDNAVITGDHEMVFVLTQTLQNKPGVNATNTKIQAALYTLKFTVNPGTTTTVSGTLLTNDQTGEIKIDSVQDLEPITLYKSIPVDNISIMDGGSGTAKVSGDEGATVTIGNMEVKLPKGTVIALASENNVSKETSTTGTADGTFGFQKRESGSVTVDAGTVTTYELTLPVSTSSSKDKGNPLVTVKNFIGKNLAVTEVYHGNVKLNPETEEKEPTDKEEGYYYNSGTGYLTLYIYHASEFNIVTRPVVAKIGDTSYYTLEDAIDRAQSSDEIKLTDDVTVTEAIEFKKSVTIDLMGKTLNFAVVTTGGKNKGAFELADVDSDSTYTVTIKNGSIKGTMTGTKANVFTIHSYATLALDKVDMDVTAFRGIQLFNSETNPKLTVTDSTIKVSGGAYAVSTEAEQSASTGVEITISGSTLKTISSDDDNTALLINVPGTYNLENSTFSGARQGAIFRGGEFTVSGSTFEATGSKTNYNKDYGDYLDCNWGSGNEVPLAAIVIGNRSTGYAYPTTVTFSGTNTLTVGESKVRKQLYVYQANNAAADTKDTNRKVEVIGANGNWTINDNINGADWLIAKVGETYYSSLHDAILNAADGSTIELLNDASGSGLETKDGQVTKDSLTVDFGGHTYTVINTSVGSSGIETQAMHWGKSVSSITLKNGTIATKKFDTLKMGMQNHTNLTAENMTFDMSEVTVTYYDDKKYEESYPAYYKKEVPIFNNNKEVMKLTNCTVILPDSSTMGMSADGESVTLENTTVYGAVNLQDLTSKLTKDAGTVITKDVVSYFDGNTVVTASVAEGNTTYTLNAVSTN